MTEPNETDSRLTDLEQRLALAEGRLALVEARPQTFFPTFAPMSFGGYTCSLCRGWIPWGTSHVCGNMMGSAG